MIYLFIVGGVIIAFFLVIFTIATIRVLKKSKSIYKFEKVGAKEKVFAVLIRNGKKEFIQ